MTAMYVAEMAGHVLIETHGIKDLGVSLMYETIHPSRKRRQKVEDMDKFAEQWKEVLLAFATAHTREQLDAADYRTEDLFKGILNMPVGQVREFFNLLLEKLKADDRVPYYLWFSLEKWKEKAVGVAEDVEAKVLQAELAGELAGLLEPALSGQLRQALQESLKWKSADVLARIKAAVESGQEVRMTGRESCLFLEFGGEKVML
jgi:hypothetical protein